MTEEDEMPTIPRRELLAALGGAAGAAALAQVAPADTTAPDQRTLVAYCGLYCGLCDARTRTAERAAALMESLELAEWPKQPEFWRVLVELATVPPDKCCRTRKCGHPACAIRNCAAERNVEACPLCDEYPCARIDVLAASETTMLHDGRRMRKLGIDAWVEEQEERRRRGFCYSEVRCLPCRIPTE
jgi:hypothetical protein